MTNMGYRLHAFRKKNYLIVNVHASDDWEFARESCEEQSRLPAVPGLSEGDAFWSLRDTPVPQPFYLDAMKWPSAAQLMEELQSS